MALGALGDSPARAACPLPNPADCIYVDVDSCGACANDGSACSSNAQCFGSCWGLCDDGTTACQGDVDCAGIFFESCNGLCGGVGPSCIGDAECAGSCTGGAGLWNGSQANPFCEIQAGYDAAQAGDTILVLPGTYRECVNAWGFDDPVSIDKGVNLVADAFLTQADNTQTVIDATGLCDEIPALQMGGTAATLNGFTITGGTASGIYGQGGVVITNNRVIGNASAVGGGVYVFTGACYYPTQLAVEISGNTISNNASAAEPPGQLGEALGDGGGLYVVVEEFSSGPLPCLGGNAQVTIDDNLIADNTIDNQNTDPMSGTTYPIFGGGLYLRSSTEPGGGTNVRITRNTISGNIAAIGSESYGGGAWVGSYTFGGTEEIAIEGNVIESNVSTLDGGGMSSWVQADGPAAIGDVTVRVGGNSFVGNQAFGRGGGLDMFAGIRDFSGANTLLFRTEQNVVAGNVSGDDGGGIFALFIADRTADLADVAAGLAHPAPAEKIEFELTANQILDNTSGVGGGGAALYEVADADPESGSSGPCAAILPSAASIDFTSNWVAGNVAQNFPSFDEVGGGVFALVQTVGNSRATVNIEDSTVAINAIDSGIVGGVEILPARFPACDGTNLPIITMRVDRSVVASNDAAGIGGTPISGVLSVPVTNTWSFGHTQNFEEFLFGPTPPPGNFQTDPLVDLASYRPDVCSDVFDLSVCRGTTTACATNANCSQTCIGGQQNGQACSSADDCDSDVCRLCVAGAGFHRPPDATGDDTVDGLDVLDLATAFSSSDNGRVGPPDPRYDPNADLDLDGIVDGDDLTYMAAEFGQVCNP
jgi:hypothetical protein